MPPQNNATVVAIGYTRVSTKREEMISPELQAHEQDTYAARHGIRIVERVEDIDLSGRDFARRSVDYIVKGIKEGRWNTVLLWKWSRWGRNLLQSRLYLAEVEQAGGQVIAVTEDFDTTTSVGKFSRDQMLAIAELQSNQIAESWKEAHARRRRMGLPHTSNPRFGYTYSKDHGYQVDERDAALLKSLYERFVAGEPMRQLALDLNSSGYRTTRGNPHTGVSLGRMLDNGFAAGLIRERSEAPEAESTGKRISQYDIWRKGAHEAIISTELWEGYRDKRLANEHTAPRLRVAVHSLSGLVFCSQCLTRMSATKGGSGGTWRCRRMQESGACVGASIGYNRLQNAVRAWVMKNAQGGESVEADARRVLIAQEATLDVEACQREVTRLKNKRKRLLDIYTDGGADEEDYKEKKAEIDAELESADSALREAKAAAREVGTDYRQIFTTLADLWDAATPHETRELLSKLIERIEIERGSGKPKRCTVFVQPRWGGERVRVA
ncbi:recombinase family protein [Nonomuraea sp. NPDC050643]|uniref:recombinase family protein n=1 Tax=Nonomuraea sp. NPDC050643 TaxID=3155660 RepID=UPI0033F34C0B